MTTSLYSIYDIKGNLYSCPFSALNDNLAIRVFYSLVSQPNSNYNLYPDDFVLYCIGNFDDNTSNIVSCTPRPVLTADCALKQIRALLNNNNSSDGDSVHE